MIYISSTVLQPQTDWILFNSIGIYDYVLAVVEWSTEVQLQSGTVYMLQIAHYPFVQ